MHFDTDVCGTNIVHNRPVPPMWTRRPDGGDTMGDKSTLLFSGDLEKWVPEGEAYNGRKCSSMM